MQTRELVEMRREIGQLKREALENSDDIAGDESDGDVDFGDSKTQSVLKKKVEGCKVREDRSTGLRYISGYMTGG